LFEKIPEDLLLKIIYRRMCSTPAFMNPVIKATCSIDKNEIAAGEYAKVIVTVEGDAVEQIIPVPTAVVLTLDESGSNGR